MAIRFIEIHAAEDAEKLNTEWFVLENPGEKPFNTRNCVLSVRRKGQKKKRNLGTIDPGFVLAPGEKMRVLTGNPGRKAHGEAPKDDTPNYNLFLGEPVLAVPGLELTLSLRTLPVCRATHDPESSTGVKS